MTHKGRKTHKSEQFEENEAHGQSTKKRVFLLKWVEQVQDVDSESAEDLVDVGLDFPSSAAT